MREVATRILRLLGAALALISCIPMLATLPAGFVAVLSLIGLTPAPVAAWAAPFAPVAPLLFILSTTLLAIGHSRCGWQPASVVVLGGLLVYLSMYVFVVPANASPAAQSLPMPGMPTAGATGAMPRTGPTMPTVNPQSTMAAMIGRTNAPLFYVGLILMAGSFGLVWWRHRLSVCRPFHPLSLLRGVFVARQD